MTETTTPSTPTQTGRCHGRRRGLRRFVFATALVLTGVGIGVATSAVSQGYNSHWGPHMGARGGWSESGPMQGGPGPHHGGPGWGHHRHGAGPMFGPGSVERMMERLVYAADASSEQKQKMNAIAQRAAEDVMALRDKHLAGRKQMRDILAAPTIDRAKLESLRAEQMKLADDASKRVTAAVADIAEVLTPTQRADLAKRMERRFGGGR